MRAELAAAALRDLTGILDRIRSDNPLAAERMKGLFLKKFRLLESQPRIGIPGVLSGTRELPVQGSYRVVYRIAGDRLLIEHVMHTARLWPPASALSNPTSTPPGRSVADRGGSSSTGSC